MLEVELFESVLGPLSDPPTVRLVVALKLEVVLGALTAILLVALEIAVDNDSIPATEVTVPVLMLFGIV